jgi:hypothetical protein
LTNAVLLKKANEELKLCMEKNLEPKDLIKKCLAELET